MHRSNGVATRDEDEFVPPNDEGAEQRLLGCCFRDPSLIDDIVRGLAPDSFHSYCHRKVFESIVSLRMNEAVVDPVTVGAELQAMGVLKDIGGAPAILEIVQSQSVTAAGWGQYKGIVCEREGQREFYRFAQEMLRDAKEPSDSLAEILEAYGDRISDMKRRASGASAKPTFSIMNGPQLRQADFTVNYIIKDVLVEGQPGCIGAPEKHCKTIFGLEALVAASFGTDFMGDDRFPSSRKYRSLIMTGESGGAVVTDNLAAILRRDGKTLDDLTDVWVSEEVPNLSDDEQLEMLRNTVEEAKAEIVLIDPAYMALGGDVEANNLFSMGAILRRISDMGRELGFTPLFCHHMNKLPLKELPKLHHLSWAGWRQWLRQWFLINRMEEFDPNSQPRTHRFVLSIGGSAGHAGLYDITVNEGTRNDPDRTVSFEVNYANVVDFQPEPKQDGSARAERTAQARRAKVMLALKMNPEGLTKSKLSQKTGINGTVLKDVISDLISRDGIFRFPGKVNGKDETFFKLKHHVNHVKSDFDSVRHSDLGGQSVCQTPPIGESIDIDIADTNPWSPPTEEGGF